MKLKMLYILVFILIGIVIYLLYQSRQREKAASIVISRQSKILQKQDSTIAKLWVKSKTVKVDTVILPAKVIRIKAKQPQNKDTVVTVFSYFDKALIGKMITRSKGEVFNMNFQYNLRGNFIKPPEFKRVNLTQAPVFYNNKGKFYKGVLFGSLLSAATISVFTNKYKPFLATTGAVTLVYFTINLN